MAEKFEIWGVHDPNISAQLALALKLDLFRKEAGLDIGCRFIESGTTMPKDVLDAKQPPFAIIQTPITGILLHDKGFSTKILAPLADIAGTQQVVIRPDSDIRAPKDLQGKRLGMAKGAAVFIAILNMAKDYQVDLDQTYFINLLPSDQLNAFKEHRLDAIACWEPWTSEAVAAGGQFYFSGNRSEVPGMSGPVNWLVNQSCLMVPDANIEQHPDVLIAILKVFKKATEMINQKFDDVVDLLADFFQKPREELASIMRKNNYSMTIDTLFRIGVLSFRDFLFENGRVAIRFAEDQLYRTDILREVDPRLVSLRSSTALRSEFFEKDHMYFRKDLRFQGDLSSLRFLLADDSRVVRSFLNQTLELLGATALGEATNGSEAIEMFTSLRPNFMTMDLAMPGLSGVDAIRQILEIDPSTNIIVISGLDMEEVREEVFKLGVRMFIKKPFNPQKAADVIRTLVKKSAA